MFRQCATIGAESAEREMKLSAFHSQLLNDLQRPNRAIYMWEGVPYLVFYHCSIAAPQYRIHKNRFRSFIKRGWIARSDKFKKEVWVITEEGKNAK